MTRTKSQSRRIKARNSLPYALLPPGVSDDVITETLQSLATEERRFL